MVAVIVVCVKLITQWVDPLNSGLAVSGLYTTKIQTAG